MVNRKGGGGSGLSRENNFSGGGVCRRGAAHFLGSKFQGGGGGGGGGSGPVFPVATPVTVRFSYHTVFNWGMAPVVLGTMMSGVSTLYAKTDYDDWELGIHIHTDDPCGYGVRQLFNVQMFGVRPMIARNLQNVFTNYFGAASWDENVNPGTLKAKMVYSVNAVGLASMKQRMDFYSNVGSFSGSSLADTSVNISVFGQSLLWLSALPYTVYRMEVVHESTGYSFTQTIPVQSYTAYQRVSDATDDTWIALPIT